MKSIILGRDGASLPGPLSLDLSPAQQGIERRFQPFSETGQVRVENQENDECAEEGENAGDSPIHDLSSKEIFGQISVPGSKVEHIIEPARKKEKRENLSTRFPERQAVVFNPVEIPGF
jgi:hypothetical protein